MIFGMEPRHPSSSQEKQHQIGAGRDASGIFQICQEEKSTTRQVVSQARGTQNNGDDLTVASSSSSSSLSTTASYSLPSSTVIIERRDVTIDCVCGDKTNEIKAQQKDDSNNLTRMKDQSLEEKKIEFGHAVETNKKSKAGHCTSTREANHIHVIDSSSSINDTGTREHSISEIDATKKTKKISVQPIFGGEVSLGTPEINSLEPDLCSSIDKKEHQSETWINAIRSTSFLDHPHSHGCDQLKIRGIAKTLTATVVHPMTSSADEVTFTKSDAAYIPSSDYNVPFPITSSTTYPQSFTKMNVPSTSKNVNPSLSGMELKSAMPQSSSSNRASLVNKQDRSQVTSALSTFPSPSLSMRKSGPQSRPPQQQQRRRQQQPHVSDQSPLRRGKWTIEEEGYVSRVIRDFNSGYLSAPAGTTLRTYLSEKLNCDPMRITKKFTGDSCIGKRVFHPAVRCAANSAAIDKAQTELDVLEKRWRKRLEVQQREALKKAGRHAILNISQSAVASNATQNTNQHAVARTATWLDRANTVLSNNQNKNRNNVEDQMKEVQELLHEGPVIHQTSAGIPRLIENVSTTLYNTPISAGFQQEHSKNITLSSTLSKRKVALGSSVLPPNDQEKHFNPPTSHNVSESIVPLAEESSSNTKKSKTSDSDKFLPSDAEALVGFLNCVRRESSRRFGP